MKLFILFVLLVTRVGGNKTHSLLSHSFDNISRHLFKLETRMFIDNYGLDSTTVSSLILKSLNERAMPFFLRNLELDTEQVLMNSSALLTFNSFDNLRTFNKKLKLTNKFYKPLQLFIYCQNTTFKNIKSLILDAERKAKQMKLSLRLRKLRGELVASIQYEYFLMDEAEFVKLLTFVWHTPRKCSKWQLIELNRFSKVQRKWESDDFVMEKLSNFHGCDLVYTTAEYALGSKFFWIIPSNIAKQLNYKYWFEQFKGTHQLDVYFTKACYNPYDIQQLHKPASVSNVTMDFFTSRPLEFSEINLSAPPADNYSEYDKLVMPFDDFTWALIAFTFVISFTTILILNRVRRSTREFVIESSITTPSLNVAIVFFGLGMIVLPRRNFARFLTMSFILYSLIIRTAWQGKMFEFMQKNVSKPEIQTAEEMIEQGFTFYMESAFRAKYAESEIAKRCRILNNSTNIPRKSCQIALLTPDVLKWLPEKLLDPTFKGAIQTDPSVFSIMLLQSSGRTLYRTRKEVINVQTCGMKFLQHHHFYSIFDRKSQQLADAGIVPHYYEKGNIFWFDTRFSYMKSRYKFLFISQPKVLTMQKLEPGFVIWTSSWSLAFLGFFLEWLLTFKDFLVVKFVLLAFYRTRDEIGRFPVEKTEDLVGEITCGRIKSDVVSRDHVEG